MEVFNNRLLVENGDWNEVNKTANNVRVLLMDRLARQRAIPANEGMAYWVAVPRSITSSTLFYVQCAPVWAFQALTNRKMTHSINFQRIRALIRHEWLRWTAITKSSGILVYMVAQFRGLGRAYGKLARDVAKGQVSRLEEARDEASQQIARLLLVDPRNYANTDNSFVTELIKAQKSSVLDPKCSTPDEAMAVLQQMLDQSQHQKLSRCVPSFSTRWWPALLLSLLTVYKLQGSWPQVVSWLEESVWVTLQSFAENWVVGPLKEIYETIRHEDNEKVGLIAQQSLPSDRRSLERMVVDFARDMNRNLSSTELRAIGESALNGNMDPVMEVYEKQIDKPIINLVAGNLIRAMLIQVQKSKVDVEVALSGIDQLLQSQKLVFGLVAAVPAFGVLWWVTRLVSGYLYQVVYGWRASRSSKDAVFGSLQWLDLVSQSSKQKELSLTEVGLIYCAVTAARDAIPHQDSIAMQQLWQNLDRIVNHAVARNSAAVMADMDRLYSRYMAVKMQF